MNRPMAQQLRARPDHDVDECKEADASRRAPHSPPPLSPTRTLAALSRGVYQPERSVQPEHAIDGADFGWSNQAAMANRDRVQAPVQLGLPELQEALQLGEIRTEIVVLPDIGLQQPRMVGSPVKDFGGCQAVSLHLSFEIVGDHSGNLDS